MGSKLIENKKDLIKKYNNKMKKCIEIGEGDIEAGHEMADELLCDLLKELGFESIVNAYKKVYRIHA